MSECEKIPCKLSVVIPCYNERGTIREIVERVGQAPVAELEIIVVDNLSTDGTRDILREEIEPKVARVIYNERNIGKSGSVIKGIAAATGDAVIVQDADLEYDPVEGYPALLGPIVRGEADVVYGSRFKTGAGPRGATANYVANRLLTRLSNLTTGWRLTDMETCYKMFRREVIQAIELREGGFGFEPEVTAKLARAGVRVAEVPISYDPRTSEEGKKVGFADGVHSVCCILRYGPRTRALALGALAAAGAAVLAARVVPRAARGIARPWR
ncbi:MAG: glycosyltransferase family 2 protein [Coriobacteriales bacterium]|nr:glycosyltransferase family 2 protein [Coriobacteriales bacterium]